MSSLLNSIFFIKKENLNLGTVLGALRSFMLTNVIQAAMFLRSNIITPTQIVRIEDLKTETNAVIENIEFQKIEDVVEDPPIVHVIKRELISPKQSDTLFWCLFVIHFGYDEYVEVDRNYGVKELEIKKLVGEHISANPYKIKNSNIKFTKATVQEVLSELLTIQKDTSPMTKEFTPDVLGKRRKSNIKRKMIKLSTKKRPESTWKSNKKSPKKKKK
jgi:hypothetical protein